MDSPESFEASPKRPATILGRLTQAVRQQNWFAVALEIAIVVFGVVIGFQVTAWAEERADRNREQEYLSQLVTDFEQIEGTLAYSVAWAEERLEQAEIIQEVLEGTVAETVRAKDIALALYAPGLIVDIPVPRDTWADLVSTGRLQLLRNRDLRWTISAFYRNADQQRAFMGDWRTDVKPYMGEVSNLLSNRLIRAISSYVVGGRVGTVPDSLIPPRASLIQAIQTEPTMRTTSVAIPIVNWAAVAQYSELLEQAEAISAQLRAELAVE